LKRFLRVCLVGSWLGVSWGCPASIGWQT
jgi:hypothetical protein